ncbi:RNA-binding S4 domain-containing protein [Sphingomonas jatrophae]|uniref:Ribosome-associated heat shock protein Hsp15 n=1 Tax=Sphingomonas jatrophae TaxID=1166337 RepID=A0A1I6LJ18_9SPHN|nr:RNA-binding S4 domain-containing protein [Sphingomonas jatrophae]SFS03465.1 ribosome-associated heat shock protein Hsp15 [Sphingomonas jatrophae]
MRLDKFLWFTRLTKTRTLAQALAAEGHLRIDGRAVDRAHAEVRVGQVLSFPLHGRVRVLRVLALPARRGSAPEAQACYDDLAPPPQAANVSQQAASD